MRRAMRLLLPASGMGQQEWNRAVAFEAYEENRIRNVTIWLQRWEYLGKDDDVPK